MNNFQATSNTLTCFFCEKNKERKKERKKEKKHKKSIRIIKNKKYRRD
jgi:hypothetical protein